MKKFLDIVCCFLLFISCSDDAYLETDFVAGETFTDSNIRVIQLDTLTVKLSTMKFDSIVTSGSSRMLVGEYDDPVYGRVNSSSYMEMIPSSYTIDSDAVYDSLIFILRYDNYYYNDTLTENTIHIKSLSEKLSPDDTSFYNTTISAYNEEDLGTFTNTPRPIGKDTLIVSMSDSFGLDIFEKFQEKDITTYDEFTDYFYGVTIQPDDSNNGAIIGFSTASTMRLYYSIAGETESVQYFSDFSSSSTLFYNQISAEQPNDYLTTLTDKEINLYSEDADDQSFVQCGMGVSTRIEFPYIKSLFDIQGQGTLIGATLKIKPKEGSYDDALILRDTMAVFTVDQNNDLSGETTMLAVLNRDDQEFNNIYYEISLSSYLDDLLVTEENTSEALILLPYDYVSTVDRFVLDVDKENKGTQLELTYAIYDENE